MKHLDEESAIRAGGWDPRYAIALIIVTRGEIAAALIDPNGDGADIDLDQYRRSPDGDWVAGISGGGAGDDGSSWSPDMVAEYGRAEPGRTVTLDYLGERHQVNANDAGWWLFIIPPKDDGTLAKVRSRS